jgi:hypothetical protein
MMEMGGNIAIARAPLSTNVLPGNRRRAMAYAANVARRTAKKVAISAIPMEFRNGRVNWPVLKMEV